MAVARVSTGYPYSIRTVTEGCQYELGGYPGRTGHPNNPEIWRILKAAHAGQVRCTVTAPVTEKGCDFWFPVAHPLISSSPIG
jgi:hypothetical protein